VKKPPITHLVIDTSSSSEDDTGGCDYCLVPMTAEYVAYLLDTMDEVRRLHRTDKAVYSLECWDGSPAFLQFNEQLQELRDVDGDPAVDVPRGEPILLTADPEFSEEDFQRVDCRTVQVSGDEAWWTAYVKGTNLRIESAHVEKKTLLRVLRSLGGRRQQPDRCKRAHISPAIRRIHDLLYLDMQGGREFYTPDKSWDADTLDAIAEVVAEFIPRPPQARS